MRRLQPAPDVVTAALQQTCPKIPACAHCCISASRMRHTEPAGLSTCGPAFNPQVRVISARATFVPERAETTVTRGHSRTTRMTAERDTYRLTPCPKRPDGQRVTRAAELPFQLQFTAVQEVHAGPAKGVGPGWTALNGHDLRAHGRGPRPDGGQRLRRRRPGPGASPWITACATPAPATCTTRRARARAATTGTGRAAGV